MTTIPAEFKDDLTLVVQVWRGAVQETADPESKNTEALVRGVNFRINVAEAFKAAWETAKFAVKLIAHSSTGGTFTLFESLDLGVSGYKVVTQTLDAVRKQVAKEVYVACVVLGGHESGLTEAQFRSELMAFISGVEKIKLPWYLGISEACLSDAKKRLTSAGGFENLMIALRDKWIVERDGLLHFKPRHFVWGFSEEEE